MAKKPEKIIIKNEELQPQTIGQVTDNKAHIGPMIILFIIFIGAIYFSPYISNWYENYKNGGVSSTPSTTTNTNKTTTTDTTTAEETITKYDYSDNMTIKDEKISVNNLLIKNNTLAFTINNLTDNYLNLANYNYFLEFYNGDTLVARQRLEQVGLQKSGSTSYSYKFNYTDITKVDLRNISKDDYPEVSITVDDNKKGTLICSNSNETLTYYALDSKIYSIQDIFSYSSTNSDYETMLSKYQSLVTSYSTITGFTTSIKTTTTGFVYNNLIDLTNAKLTNVNNSNYYANETSINVVSFELNANGYSCK